MKKKKTFFDDITNIQYIGNFFSFEGELNRPQSIRVFVIIYALIWMSGFFNNSLLTYLLGLFLFYPMLATVQKRCRNFGSKGTWWIILFTIAMILASTTYFINAENTQNMWQYLKKLLAVLYILLFVLFYIPSKPDADKELRSPLLKYPLLYVGICWIVAITATLAVNHYAGVKVPLF